MDGGSSLTSISGRDWVKSDTDGSAAGTVFVGLNICSLPTSFSRRECAACSDGVTRLPFIALRLPKKMAVAAPSFEVASGAETASYEVVVKADAAED